jgi:flavin-dependent dehydrogenase
MTAANGNGRRPDYDASVVGAGHNGLTAGAYLARAGVRVCVLEARDLVGGRVRHRGAVARAARLARLLDGADDVHPVRPRRGRELARRRP